MPELPDLTLYLDALRTRTVGQPVRDVRIAAPALLKTFDPPIESVCDRLVVEVRLLGKKIAWGLEGNLWIVMHLMVAGRLHWRNAGASVPNKTGLAAFDFPHGSLILTESGARRLARLWIVKSPELRTLDPGGLDPLTSTLPDFVLALQRENHTLKRALTLPHLLSGIGNAYSDEILHRAQLSPCQLTQNLSAEELARLHAATAQTLRHWISSLREMTGDDWPEKVTAFRSGMAVHGRFGKPCPICKSPIQRIVRTTNEVNYCATCQTGGKVLADRSLSRLLQKDWPSRIEDWE
ncbi:MAG: formamidopyrimidine-DNA glycosylase [Planctomycetaceae bacterium]|nr:formamidopyrimidine-DNA glycosylase [Planctomycetaceae bacterium]